jgi:phage repressor protein C with HTH and peptisase S24 domain
MSRLYKKIREIIETTSGLTQKGLAEHMGLDPASVYRICSGQRKIMADEIPVIESYLGVHLELSDAPAAARRPPEGHMRPEMVPVYGYTADKGLNLSHDNAVDWVMRHPAQTGISGAFAIYVFSDSMEPRYFQGELVYLHPGRPPELNRDCVIEMKNGEVCLKRFLRQSGDWIRVAQFNPPEEKEILRKDIKAVYAVVGRG